MKELEWDKDKTNFMLHHYTSLDSLAMILKNKTIKLNRLDLSNDPLEKHAEDIKNFGKFFFFSSWTSEKEESIPMWRMYASNPIDYGVRISLPRYFYKIWHKDFDNPVTYDTLSTMQIPGSMSKTEISIMELGKEMEIYYQYGFHLMYEFLTNRFPFNIKYVKSEKDLFNKYYKHVQDIEYKDRNALIIPIGLGTTKHKRWKYESEYRYLVEIYHKDLRPIANISEDEVSEVIEEYIEKAKLFEPPRDDFFLSIHESAFEKMIITLNPMAEEGFRYLVETLTENFYNKTGIQIQIKDSLLRNRVVLK